MPAKRVLDHSTDDARKAAKTGRERNSTSPNSEHRNTEVSRSEVCHILVWRRSAGSGPASTELRWGGQQAPCTSTAENCDQPICTSNCRLQFPHLIMQTVRAGSYPAVWRVCAHGPQPRSGADKICARNKLHVSYKHES